VTYVAQVLESAARLSKVGLHCLGLSVFFPSFSDSRPQGALDEFPCSALVYVVQKEEEMEWQLGPICGLEACELVARACPCPKMP
jgi:hypothetical protein